MLAVAGQYLPIVGFSIVGTAISTRIFGVALVAIALAATATALLLWSPSAAGTTVLVAAVAAVLGSVSNGVRQLATARRADVAVRIAPAVRRPRVDTTPDAAEVYLRTRDEELSLSIWRAVGTGARAPIVVVVHGGGWVNGDRDSGGTPGHARWLADRGYLVVAVDYSLSSPERHLWDVQEGQIAEAIRWVAGCADRLGGDPRRIALIGESAGGNLVLNVGSRIAAGQWALSVDGEPVVIRAISALYPGVDLRTIWYSRDVVLGKWLRTLPERYIGGSPDRYPARYDAVDSSTHISVTSPPTLLAFGTLDHLVEPRTVRTYARRLREAGVAVRTLEMPHSGHGFDEEGSIGCQIYRELTLRWLAAHAGPSEQPGPRHRTPDLADPPPVDRGSTC
ncbi:alpha/beta hydrolase [Nocardia aurantia]|nr:alpha/beta hydrolase [Nocardia aurantia]